MNEINPADVPQMMLDGELKFGMELEFSDSFELLKIAAVGKLIAFDMTGDHNNQYFKAELNETLEKYWYRYARFPEPKLPDLRDGDPVMVGYKNSDAIFRRIFKEWNSAGQMVIWADGLNRWTTRLSNSWQYGRPATKQELLSKGYTDEQINEMLNRWGVSGTTRVG